MFTSLRSITNIGPNISALTAAEFERDAYGAEVWANRPALIAAVDLQVELIHYDWPQAGVDFSSS